MVERIIDINVPIPIISEVDIALSSGSIVQSYIRGVPIPTISAPIIEQASGSIIQSYIYSIPIPSITLGEIEFASGSIVQQYYLSVPIPTISGVVVSRYVAGPDIDMPVTYVPTPSVTIGDMSFRLPIDLCRERSVVI